MRLNIIRSLLCFVTLTLFSLIGCKSANPNLPEGSSVAPVPGTVDPKSGAGARQVFTATYSHPTNPKSIEAAFLLIAPDLNAKDYCFVEYNSWNNTVNLMDDHGKWQTSIKASEPGTLANSQCAVDATGVHGSIQEKVLSVTFPLTFTPAYGGKKSIYLAVTGRKRSTSWQPRGEWQVP
jgi:hypothetical protein